jgi:hypothetical protein
MNLKIGWVVGGTETWILIGTVVVFMLVVALFKLSKE